MDALTLLLTLLIVGLVIYLAWRYGGGIVDELENPPPLRGSFKLRNVNVAGAEQWDASFDGLYLDGYGGAPANRSTYLGIQHGWLGLSGTTGDALAEQGSQYPNQGIPLWQMTTYDNAASFHLESSPVKGQFFWVLDPGQTMPPGITAAQRYLTNARPEFLGSPNPPDAPDLTASGSDVPWLLEKGGGTVPLWAAQTQYWIWNQQVAGALPLPIGTGPGGGDSMYQIISATPSGVNGTDHPSTPYSDPANQMCVSPKLQTGYYNESGRAGFFRGLTYQLKGTTGQVPYPSSIAQTNSPVNDTSCAWVAHLTASGDPGTPSQLYTNVGGTFPYAWGARCSGEAMFTSAPFTLGNPYECPAPGGSPCPGNDSTCCAVAGFGYCVNNGSIYYCSNAGCS